MLKRVNCGSLEAGKHNNYLCLTLWHTFLLFIFLFLKSEWNSSLVGSLSDCQTFQWSHLKVPFFFFPTCGQFSLFRCSSDLWNSRIIFSPLPGAPIRDPEAQTSEALLCIFTSAGTEDGGHLWITRAGAALRGKPTGFERWAEEARLDS